MNEITPLPAELARTRAAFAQIATHVMARRRFAATGRFGLRAVPGAIATPMFADEVLRLTSTALLRERRAVDRIETTSMLLRGATLGALAEFSGADLDAPFSVGHDTPALVDPAQPLHVAVPSADLIVAWFGTAAEALDEIIARRPGADATAVQLWPEHFDLAVDALVARGRVNLGASPGDAFCDEPYLYVGPWDAARPGDGSFWNAPFGAVLRRCELAGAGEPRAAMRDFWSRGLALLGDAPGHDEGAGG